ncbi:MAG: polysaccharide deacetylase family protein [Pseudomonadota bacterium]|nr:polysaccharide deacetylase family protein [Pseudomonadota bacterium]
MNRLFAFALLCVVWSAAVHAAPPVVLLRSDTTAAFFLANGGDYERILTPWRSLFARHGIKAQEMPAEQLASLKQPAVLVLASTAALGDAERDAIRSRLAAGWSVLGTWGVGVRDGKGGWTGYDFIDEVFAARVAPELAPAKDERFLLPFGETPLTHALPAGKRIYLLPTNEPLLRVHARNAAARFGNYMRDATLPGALLGAAAFDERDGARRAYFGFAETTWDSAQADLDAMLLGTLDWLGRKPIVMKSAWPHPHQAALLLEMDTEDKFENSVRFAAVLERFGIRGTFYSLTSEAIRYPNVVKRLASRHEIAYHAEVHTGFAKLARKQQDERLKSMIKQMSRLLPDASAATGFRAPLEEYDATTEELLRANGLRHHAASPAARDDMLPGFSSAEPGLPSDKALVVLPRTWHDDIKLFTTGLLKGAPAEQMLLASLQDTLAMRGFGLLSLHTQQFYAGSVMERATPRLLESVANHGDQIWTAPGEEIARWWRDREAVQILARDREGELHIQLKVARQVKRVKLVLIAPDARPPQLEAGADIARVEKLDAYRWAIVLPELREGDSELRIRF